MRTLKYDVVVIGGGPAGLAAALKAREKAEKVAVLERNDELGGILNQCIHSGFGLHVFKEELTGPEYAQRYVDMVKETDISCYLNTMVINVTEDKHVIAMSEDGMLVFEAASIVLAMGCRERTRGQIRIPGTRPAGVFTAGLAQRYVNLENFKPGSRVVILGSGDIGLIMARRLTLEGIKVVGVYELMPYANGLYRNIKNCLDDFGIPLHLSTTVTKIVGSKRVQAVEVSAVDENLKPIPGTEEIIPCDTVLLSIGLIPENELSKKAGIELNPVTNGPKVDNALETSVKGIFACGNVLHVHDLVDQVTKEAEDAGMYAAEYAAEQKSAEAEISVVPEGLVRYTVPTRIASGRTPVTKIKFRVGRPVKSAKIRITSGDQVIFESKKAKKFVPSIMENVNLTAAQLADVQNEIKVTLV
jgi:NADPH-dependent 2,4-dienoyl-CoA reductase/sulfur reductase-like enzyme